MKKLTIFVPTYKRARGLDKLLFSIFENNSEEASNVEVVISSNSPEDVESRIVVERWRNKYDNIHCFYNESDIGIDRNHDLVYQYCTTPYALLLADDDYLQADSLGTIINGCVDDFDFGIINAFPAPSREDIQTIIRYKIKKYIRKIKPVYFIDEGIINADECFKLFSDESKTIGILPLLLYYSGILVNMTRVKNSISFSSRNDFCGTMHQYIGTLWNEIFENDGHVKLFAKPMIYISFAEHKTWTNTMHELITRGLPQFYYALSLPENIRYDLLLNMEKRTSKWKEN
ncbi:glycosyltransferase family 2 protein [Selenomonas ruminantium]|uniref:glycosyltransferase family 2 protein n=1 Tax=Selenomonas ruminantium TaxID=971 RepID=UPI00041CC59D|nr:glycosyltransferase family 2 protein [Selenomonas ruminantium]